MLYLWSCIKGKTFPTLTSFFPIQQTCRDKCVRNSDVHCPAKQWMHFLSNFCSSIARLWCCIFISHTLLVTWIWYTAAASFTITTLYSGRPRRWMSPLRWIMCRNKRGKRSSGGLLVILAKCLCTSHDLNESLDDRFFRPYTYLWSDEESYVTSIIMTFVLLVGCCIYAWEDVALRLMLMSRKRRKNQIMLAIPGWSFFLSKIPGICLQCAHLHYDWWWKMEEALHQQGRRRCLSPASSCSMTLWARGIIYQELRREKPCLLTYQDSEKIFCNATRSTLGSYLGFLSSPSSFVVFENSPQSLMFSKLRNCASERMIMKNETF